MGTGGFLPSLQELCRLLTMETLVMDHVYMQAAPSTYHYIYSKLLS